MDLPFTEARWRGTAGVRNVVVLSDYKDKTLGKNTAPFIEELGLLTRAIFVVDSSNNVT